MTFDDHIRAALDRAAADARGGIEKSFTAFAQEVARAVAEERAQLTAQAPRTAVEARAQIEDARQQLQHAHRQTEEARRQAEEMRRHAEVVTRRSEAQLAELRTQADAQLAQLREAALRQVEEWGRSAEAQVSESKKAIDEVRRLAEAEIDKARRAANAEAEDLVISHLAAAAVDNDKRTQAAVARVKQEADADAVAQAARLATAIAALDQARSLGELLDYLAQCAGDEVERAAVLLRKGERLQGWRLVGFGASAPPAKSLDLDVQAAGVLGIVLSNQSSWSGKLGAHADALPAFARGDGHRDVSRCPC